MMAACCNHSRDGDRDESMDLASFVVMMIAMCTHPNDGVLGKQWVTGQRGVALLLALWVGKS